MHAVVCLAGTRVFAGFQGLIPVLWSGGLLWRGGGLGMLHVPVVSLAEFEARVLFWMRHRLLGWALYLLCVCFGYN